MNLRSLSICLLSLPALIAQEPSLTVTHGPYLQELTADGVTILWTTNQPCLGRIEYGVDELTKTAQAVRHGLVNANTTHHAVRVTGLKPGQKYKYRLVNTEILDFKPHIPTLGKVIYSDVSAFSTMNPAPFEFSFIVTQDIHSSATKYASLLDKINVDDAAFVILNGDIDSDPNTEDKIYSGHLDVAVERFAKEKPFILVRGNHEARGHFARSLFEVYPHSSGRYYYSFSHGGVFFLVLDSGSEREDSNPEYSGMNDMEGYRAEETAWIAKELQSSAAKLARYRIVFSHIPPTTNVDVAREDPAFTMRWMTEQWVPLYRSGNVDLVMSGHTHNEGWLAPGSKKGDFALFIGSNQEIQTVKVTEKAIDIHAQSLSGTERKYQIPRR